MQERFVRFTHQEAEDILKRAGDLESSRLEGDVSLAELLRTAEEIGLPRESVLAALPTKRPSFSQSKKGFFGGPLHHTASIIVEGDLTEDAWRLIIETLRQETGDAGESRQDGTARQWKATFGGVQTLTFSACPLEGGIVRLEITSSLLGLAAIVHVLGFGGIAMTGPLLSFLAPLSPLETMAAWAVGGVGLFLASRSGMSSLSEREGSRIKRLISLVSSHFNPQTAHHSVEE